MPTVTIVKLLGRKAYANHTDPKGARRRAFAGTGRNTQFINSTGDGGTLYHRAYNNLLDGFSQLGAQPPVSAGLDGLSAAVNCAGLWLVREYAASNATRMRELLPVMSSIRSCCRAAKSRHSFSCASRLSTWRSSSSCDLRA